MTSPIAVDQIVRNFGSLFANLRASIVQQLFVIWFGLEDYRDSDLKEFLELSLPSVQAAQQTSSELTSTYIQMQLEMMGLDDISPPDIDLVTGAPIRNGVPSSEVYSRPFKDVWTALSKGKDIQEAIEDGANRLRQLVETDIQLAHNHTSRNILSSVRSITGYRRVPMGAKTCALCLIASTQRYRKEHLLPIHPGCDCKVAVITSDFPSSQVVDKEFLEKVHQAIADQFGISDRAARKINYKDILFERTHGEYGPTLTVRGQHFTGPNDLT